jgi:membrane protease YdiL (CAAX protease family)
MQRSGRLRRLLSWIAVVWGALTILLFVKDGFALTGNGAFRTGQILGLVLAIALVVGGGKEIESQHVRRIRYVPWLVGLEVIGTALVVVALLVLRPLYPPSVRANFLRSCEAQGTSPGHCGCAIDWIESHKSFPEFMAMGAQVKATGALPPDVTAGIASSCPPE